MVVVAAAAVMVDQIDCHYDYQTPKRNMFINRSNRTHLRASIDERIVLAVVRAI
jgi:hypothetical protein